MTSKSPVVAERRLLNYEFAAAYLGISIRAMKDLGGPGGQILQVKIGHRVLFDVRDLDDYIDHLKRSA